MALDVQALAADVAQRLGITAEAAEPAVEAAIQYVALDTGSSPQDWLMSDWLLARQGIPLLSVRIYQDTANLGGETNQLGDPTFAGIYTAARLYSHLDEYWKHLTVNFGIA